MTTHALHRGHRAGAARPKRRESEASAPAPVPGVAIRMVFTFAVVAPLSKILYEFIARAEDRGFPIER